MLQLSGVRSVCRKVHTHREVNGPIKLQQQPCSFSFTCRMLTVNSTHQPMSNYTMMSDASRWRSSILISTTCSRFCSLVRELRDFWFKFFQKHQFWLICPLWHTVSIFAERQDERPLRAAILKKTKMAATSAQTCMIPLFRCIFGRRIQF